MRSFSTKSLAATLITLAGLTVSAATLSAQDEAEEKKETPSLAEIKGTVKMGDTPIPSPFDAFLALEMISAANKPVDWGQVLDYGIAAVDSNDYNDTVPVSLMLGVKISDGLITIKAKDTEALNDVSKAIEVLAKKINVGSDQLKRAENVRQMATIPDWLGVFLELGYLQEDIIQSLAEESRKEQRALILAAGWTQGANYAAYAIEKNFSPEASSLLREPDLISQLVKDLKATKAAETSPVVKQMLEDLPAIQKIVDVPIGGTLEEAQVKEIRTRCSALVKMIEENK